MKYLKVVLSSSVLTLLICAIPTVGWSTRAVVMVSGEVTATPSFSQIEVAHRAYHIKGGSKAAEQAPHLSLGQAVDLILDGPASNPSAEIIAILAHSGS